MALNIGELVGFIRTDDTGMRRGLTDAELRMRGLQRNFDGRLRDLHGRFVSESRLMGMALGDGIGRGGDRAGLSLGRIAGMAGSLGGVALSVGKISAALGTAVPVAAGLAATVGQIAPASGIAVTGLVSVLLATQTLKLGMVGVGDAVSAALDPSKGEEFNEALKGLAPNAQKFAKQIKALAPEFKRLQQDVQNRLFEDLDKTLKSMGERTLPVLRSGLATTATTLNSMAQGVGAAAVQLSGNGVLGQAIKSATNGLKNLSRAPGQIVTGLGQIAAAAGPSFERLTAAAGKGLDGLAKRMAESFESGGMERAIDRAVDLLGDLWDVVKNVGSAVGSIFDAAQVSGGGFIGTLKTVSGALAEAFASPAVQDGLKAIFATMSTLAQTVGPLLGQALQAIAPVFTALGPPIQTLIKALGSALQPIIKALGPVLEAAAKAFGKLIEAAAPLLPVIGDLVATLLPALTPLFDALAVVFVALAPVVKQVADTLGATLKPILAALAPIIEPLAEMIADQLVMGLELFGDLLVALSPSLVSLGESLGELMTALAPLIEAWAELSGELLEALMPILEPLIKLIGDLAAYLADDLGEAITDVVIPAVEAIAALLKGDFSGAAESAKKAVKNFVRNAIDRFTELPGKASTALSDLSRKLREKAADAGRALVNKIKEKIKEAVEKVKELPGKAKSALGDLGSRLRDAGSRLIRGFIDGIKSKFSALQSTLSGLTSKLPDWKGPAGRDAALLAPAGRLVIRGFQRGIDQQVPYLRRQLQDLTMSLPGMGPVALPALATAGAGAGGGRTYQNTYTYNLHQRDMTVRDLEALQRRQEAMERVGRPE